MLRKVQGLDYWCRAYKTAVTPLPAVRFCKSQYLSTGQSSSCNVVIYPRTMKMCSFMGKPQCATAESEQSPVNLDGL